MICDLAVPTHAYGGSACKRSLV